MTQKRFKDLSLTEVRDLSESAAAVASAVTAGIFKALADEPATALQLAARLELDLRGVEIVLPFLEELELLERGPDGYRPTPRAERELVDPESSDYQAGGLPLWLSNLQAWTRLPESLETGEPVDSANKEDESDEGIRRKRIATFMAGMAAAPRDRATRLVDGVLERTPNARTVLDLGGGPGHISRAFVERGLEATVLDRPEVIAFVREEYGLAGLEGIETFGADFLDDPLPAGPFDILLASNILHMLSPSEIRTLLRRARAVAAPHCVLAVADFVRGLSPRAARFALTMLLRTEGGNTYTLEEHQSWFKEAGFDELEVTELDLDRQLVTAVARETTLKQPKKRSRADNGRSARRMPASEALADLPGEEVEIGKAYEGARTLKVGMYGVSFRLPVGLRTGIAPGSPAFEIRATQRLGVGVIVMKRQTTTTEIRAEMAQPQDMGDGVVLHPIGAVDESGGTLSVWYGDPTYIALCLARIGEQGNGVVFLFGAERNQRGWVEQTTRALAESVTLGAHHESQDERHWREMLAGRKLTYLKSNYDRDPFGGTTGSSTREEISLGADGSFHFFHHSTFTVTTSGGSALGNDPVEDRGRWEIASVGAAVLLILRGETMRQYTLTLSNERVFLDGRQYFRTALE